MQKYFFFLLLTFFFSEALYAQAPAFPGAEGSGRYVTGGRGGKVIHVTNLNDSGSGSLREALSVEGKKTIVFDVGGVIPLQSDLDINSNTTILGQTAPYPGITLRYYTTHLRGDNVIVRFIRFRRGQERNVNDGADTFTGSKHTGVIIDHCSMSWSIDEIASFYDNNNFTMQWCVLGESLNNSGHHKGAHGYGGIWGGKLASFHHNMIAHTSNRAPRFNGARYNWKGYTGNLLFAKYQWQNAVQAENVDFRNCLVFDWGGGGCYGGPGGGYINIVNNFYKATPETKDKDKITLIDYSNFYNSQKHDAFYDMSSCYYINGNYVFGDKYGADYDWKGVSYMEGTPYYNGEYYSHDSLNAYGDKVEHFNIDGGKYVKIRHDKEVEAPVGTVTTHIATKAYSHILSYAGASLFRDDVDARYMEECANDMSTCKGSVTGIKGRIDVVADCDGYNETNFPTGKRASDFDTDNDGMPDVWEKANGLNPNDATDALDYTLDSKSYYTNLEVYANSLVEVIVREQNRDAKIKVDEYFPPCNKADGLDYYTGRKVLRLDASANGYSAGDALVPSRKGNSGSAQSPALQGGYYVAKAGDAQSVLDILEEIEANLANQSNQIKIFLPNGVYDFGKITERTLPCDNISLIGQSMDSTILVTTPDVEQEGLGVADMFYNTHNNVYFQDLTLRNALGYYKVGGAGRAAVIQDCGNRTIYKKVRMLSHQDTYYSQNNSMQSYFADCDIHGTVDFICGGGDVRFDNCAITLESRSLDGKGSRIVTAPSTTTKFGYVFDNCKIVDLSKGNGEWNFGRTWRNSPICVWLNTTLDNGAVKSLIKSRWTQKGMNHTDPKIIGEYATKDEGGKNITPSTNIITSYDGNHETILNASQAEEFTYDKMFTDWNPRLLSAQLTVKGVRLKNGRLMWKATKGATAYAVFRNDVLQTITTDTSFKIADEINLKSHWSVRAANSMGGFGSPTTL